TVIFPQGGTRTLTISDAANPAVTSTFTVLVSAQLFPSGVLVLPVLDAEFTGVIATFTTAFPGATAGRFSAPVDWGDGPTSAGTAQSDGKAAFNVLASHTYTTDTTFLVNVTITDPGRNLQETSAPSAAVVLTASQTAQLTEKDFFHSNGQVRTGTVHTSAVTA